MGDTDKDLDRLERKDKRVFWLVLAILVIADILAFYYLLV